MEKPLLRSKVATVHQALAVWSVHLCSVVNEFFVQRDCVYIVVLVVSGEGYGFLQFAWMYPRVLFQLLVFSLCSSVGQVQYIVYVCNCCIKLNYDKSVI